MDVKERFYSLQYFVATMRILFVIVGAESCRLGEHSCVRLQGHDARRAADAVLVARGR